MTARTDKRPWLAVVLAFLYPGLGHIYLREWFRALVWFFLVVTSSMLLIPQGIAPTELSVEAFTAAARQIPLEKGLALVSITVLSMVDAYWVARRRNDRQAVADGTTCPNCGKDVDQDLEFCHWCTEPLPSQNEAA